MAGAVALDGWDVGVSHGVSHRCTHPLHPPATQLVKSALRDMSISILDEGSISSAEISAKKLIDNHYYAIANKASLSKPVELNPPAAKLADFTTKFGVTWSEVLEKGLAYNAVDACGALPPPSCTCRRVHSRRAHTGSTAVLPLRPL